MKGESRTVRRLKEKPITLSSRITLENDKYILAIRDRHKRQNKSDALGYILACAQELKFYGVDICDANTISKLIGDVKKDAS